MSAGFSPLASAVVDGVLDGLASRPSRPRVLASLRDEACAASGVTARDLVSRSRAPIFVAARREFVRRARTAGFSYPDIGKALGRDHSTVMSLHKTDRGWFARPITSEQR